MTQRPTNDAETYLRPREAAERLQVHQRTLTRWADHGDIKFIRLPGGHRRYAESSVNAMLEPQPP